MQENDNKIIFIHQSQNNFFTYSDTRHLFIFYRNVFLWKGWIVIFHCCLNCQEIMAGCINLGVVTAFFTTLLCQGFVSLFWASFISLHLNKNITIVFLFLRLKRPRCRWTFVFRLVFDFVILIITANEENGEVNDS